MTTSFTPRSSADLFSSSQSTAGPFQFVKLKTTENITKACRNSHDLENVGSVAVKTFKIENVRLKDCAAKYTVKYPALRTFPEGKEEFVSHQVQYVLFSPSVRSLRSSGTSRRFGAPEKVPTYAVLDFDHADEVDEVLEEVSAVVFQYRSEGTSSCSFSATSHSNRASPQRS